MIKQKKTNTREEKEILQEYFIKCRNVFLDSYEEDIKISIIKYFIVNIIPRYQFLQGLHLL